MLRSRPAFALALVWAACTAWSQDATGAAAAIAGSLYRQGTQGARPQNPLEPSAFPELPSAAEELPPPRPFGQDERILEILQSGQVSEVGSHIRVTNGVHARYKGYDMIGDTLDGDKDTEVFTLSGSVKLKGQDDTILGDSVTVDFRKKTFRATRGTVDLKPSFFPPGRLLDDLYLKGGDAYGSGREIFGDLTHLTTCNLPNPHFEFLSKRIDVRPGKRLILRDTELWILHKHILSIAYLSIPLDSRTSRYTPVFGSDPTAGYFVKLQESIPLHAANDFLDTHTDEYTKLGPGLGIDYNYQNQKVNGLAQLYAIPKPGELDLNLHHDEKFGPDDLSVDGSYQKNDYLVSPGSTLYNVRAQLTLPQGLGNFDQLGFSDSHNSSLGFESLQELASFTDSRSFGKATHTNLSLAYSDNDSNAGAGQSVVSKALDVQFDGTTDLNRATAELQYIRNAPIGQNNNAFFGIADETPLLTVRTDSSRLLSQKASLAFPFQMDYSLGQFGTPSLLGIGASHVSRSNLDFTFARPDHANKRFDVSFDGRFQQGVYSDDAAQYVTGADVTTRYSFTRDTAFDLHYNYLQQHGFTPLDMDRILPTNLFTADVSFRPFRSLLLAAQTGYDYLQSRQSNEAWQALGIRAEWRPRDWFQMRALATYDPLEAGWSNIRMDIAYKPGATLVSAGLSYDGIRHTFSDINLFVDGFTWGRLKTSLIIDYDGYLRQFNAEHFSFTYDLHCAEAILQVLNNPVGFRPGLQLGFFLRLKALPFNTPFGIGTQGQAIGTGTGISAPN